ncbi:hypothetical protein [Thiothrix sp.]|uniref:hypothetical protein n=1 Tax=Thiothrix sp. TaxID=1032 RepID=UPI00257EF26D|nr:hypothetical protein [Thiothrix sp.]
MMKSYLYFMTTCISLALSIAALNMQFYTPLVGQVIMFVFSSIWLQQSDVARVFNDEPPTEPHQPLLAGAILTALGWVFEVSK